jgi:hypothetical protein
MSKNKQVQEERIGAGFPEQTIVIGLFRLWQGGAKGYNGENGKARKRKNGPAIGPFSFCSGDRT